MISPNPASEKLEIQMHSKNIESVKYTILDGAARKVLEGILVLENGSYNVNLQPLVTGAYSIVIEEIGSYKFIKQ
jgi:predicted  nucleic acid-binding Zn-ribbon protein